MLSGLWAVCSQAAWWVVGGWGLAKAGRGVIGICWMVWGLTVSAQVYEFAGGEYAFGERTYSVTVDKEMILSDVDLQLALQANSFGSLEDLDISLKSPSGTVIKLVASGVTGDPDGFLSGDQFRDTNFTDESAIEIEAGTAPYAASYKVDGANASNGMARFEKEQAAGVWVLIIRDAIGVGGTLYGSANKGSAPWLTDGTRLILSVVPPPSRPELGPTQDTGFSATDRLISLPKPTLAGTGLPSATVTIYEGATVMGTGVVNGQGQWTVTLSNALTHGEHLLHATAKDADGNESLGSDQLAIRVDLNVPSVSAFSDRSLLEDGAAMTLAFTVSDVETDTALLRVEAGSSQETVVTSGSLSLTGTGMNRTVQVGPLPNANGPVTISVKASDEAGNIGISSFVLTVVPVNDEPRLSPIEPRTLTEGEELRVVAQATDVDGDVLTFVLESAPPGAQVHPLDGTVTWRPTEEQGPNSYLIVVQVRDQVSSHRFQFRVTVLEQNQAPELSAIPEQVVNEGSVLSVFARATDRDLPANALTFSLAAGAPLGSEIGAQTGEFRWTPTESQGPGEYPITILVSDGGSPALSVSRTFLVRVNEVNNAPEVLSIPDLKVVEGNLLSYRISAVDNDVPVNRINYSLALGAPPGMTLDAASGELQWTPGEAEGPAVHTVTVLVTDDGSPGATVTRALKVIVSEFNTAPRLAAQGDRSVNEGETLTISWTATDSDLPGQRLVFSLEPGAPVGATIDAVTGLFRWAPGETFGGSSHRIGVRVRDNGDPELSAVQTFQVTVNEINSAPALGLLEDRSIAENTSLTFTVVASDLDIPVQAVLFSLEPGAPVGASIDPQTGVFRWLPTEGQGPGTYPIAVRATDNGAPQAASSVQRLIVTVAEANLKPVLEEIPDRVIGVGKTLSFSAKASDLDLPQNSLTFSLLGAPTGAVVDSQTGVFLWTPAAGQGASTNRMTMVVTDSGNPPLSERRDFVVTVAVGNSAPVLNAISDQRVAEGQTLALAVRASDPDGAGSVLSFNLEPGSPAGMAIDRLTGRLTWTPDSTQVSRVHTVSVRVTDNGTPNLSDVRTFKVTVQPQNGAPSISGIGDQTIAQNSSTELIVFSLSDPNTPLDQLKLTMESSNPELAPARSAVFDGTGANRTMKITPARGRAGRATITIAVEDEAGGRAAVQFELLVFAIGPQIVRDPADREVIAGAEVDFSVSATGSEPLLYQWYFNGLEIPGATNVVLKVPAVNDQAAGEYSVAVANAAGNVRSRGARLLVERSLQILGHPLNQTVLTGQGVTLKVLAIGRGALQFQWHFNGTEMPGETRAELLLPAVEAKLSGLYAVRVSDSRQSAMSAAASVRILEPPRIVRQPEGVEVLDGAQAGFGVEVTGTPPIFLQWQRDGVNLVGETNATLRLLKVEREMEGSYSVLAGNAGGIVSSAKAGLTVLRRPLIVRQPGSGEVAEGATAVFSVIAVGAEPLRYQWRFGGTTIAGATEARLVIENVRASHAGEYSVVVENVAGKVTSEAGVLSLKVSPRIAGHPVNLTVTAGASGAFRVEAGGTEPFEYQWRRNGVDIPGADRARLTLVNLQPKDAGLYRVVVRNSAGLVESREALLTVNEPPLIVTQPRSVRELAGGSVLFNVDVKGTLPISYQWRRNGVELPGAIGATFQVASLSAADAGVYDVIVRNVAAVTTSSPAELMVVQPPRIVRQPVGQTLALGASHVFTVEAAGDGPLRYQWQLNGMNLLSATNSVLTLTGIEAKDAGAYTVVVSNGAGAVTTAPALLKVILPEVSLADSASSAPSFSQSEGTFDGGDLNFSPGPQQAGLAAVGAVNSRWMSWVAPAAGIVRFDTVGSDFDTVLTVYTGSPGSLGVLVWDDDGGGFFNSAVRFNVQAGTTYYLNITGFGGAGGRIIVNFKFQSTSLKLPVIVAAPSNRTVAAGSDVTLSVRAEGTSLRYEWKLNGDLLTGETGPDLRLQSVRETQAGAYSVRVTSGTGADETFVDVNPAIVQVSGGGYFAHDKFGSLKTLTDSSAGLQGITRRGVLSPGPALSGSLVFSTVGAGKEPGEPNHAETSGGASAWFEYQATQSGVIRVSTEGSDFDTLLAIYSEGGTNLAGLKLAGANDDASTAVKTSEVRSPVLAGKRYYIAVDGAGGAAGLVKLRWNLGVGPVITQAPERATLVAGTNVTLRIGATLGTEDQNVSYQWFKNGVSMGGQGGASLSLANVLESDSGDYHVVLSSFAGAATSAVARITVVVPVKLVRVPQSQGARLGEPVVFTGVASGTAPVIYQWRFQGAPLPGETNLTLLLPKLEASQLGSYVLEASNLIGSVRSEPALLTLGEGPRILVQPQGQNVQPGARVTLSVEAAGTSPLSYQWQRNGVNIGGATGSILVLPAVQAEQAGEYTVLVSNPMDTALSTAARVNVGLKALFTVVPASQTVAVGSSTILSASASGEGELKFQWRFNGSGIPGATSANLLLANLQPSDAGVYTIVLTSGSVSLESPPARLTVVNLPVITQHPASQGASLGGTVSFTVQANSEVPLAYQWFLDRQPLAGATGATLVRSGLTPREAGSYTVDVSNAAGSVSSAVAVLTVRPVVSRIELVAGVFQFQVDVPAGKRAQVQSSSDLGTWVDVPAAGSGLFLVKEVQEPGLEARFYRVILFDEP